MRNVIIGTDWWTDCDDAVAMRLLARAHKAGQICVKGIGINAVMTDSVTSLEGFLNTEGVEDIPIGLDHAATDFEGKLTYQMGLAPYARRYRENGDAVDAVKLYRTVLAESQTPVEIVEIGFLQVLAGLLESTGDTISPKSGVELVKDKVKKIWIMAGRWDMEEGSEHNFIKNGRSRLGGYKVCKLCPVPITFLGFEVGVDVITGGELEKTDVLHRVLCDHGSQNGRRSWDPMLALMAILGDEEAAGYRAVRGTASVDPETGHNRFCTHPDGLHSYVVKTKSNEYYQNQINEQIASY